jgi:hypothetical protein
VVGRMRRRLCWGYRLSNYYCGSWAEIIVHGCHAVAGEICGVRPTNSIMDDVRVLEQENHPRNEDRMIRGVKMRRTYI